MADVDPLILSIISTAYDDLKELHTNLNIFCKANPSSDEIRQAQAYFLNIDNLRRKNNEHQNLANTMEEHYKTLDMAIDQINNLKIRNA